jgi:hypothetical protein
MILQKTQALLAAYQSQETLNYVLKVIGNDIAHLVMNEAIPVPPLKVVPEYGKQQLILDKQDENYLLKLSRHRKRQAIAQRSIQNDTTLQEITYRLLIARYPVDTNNTEANFREYLEELLDDIAQVTPEEKAAVIPDDETL